MMMKMTVKSWHIVFAIACIIITSCNKDSSDESKPYLEGTVKFNVPEFVSPGDIIKTRPSGAKHPEGGQIGYCFKFNKIMDQYDATQYLGEKESRYFIYQLPDSLGSYTLYCYAFTDDDYYPISGTQGITTVDQTSIKRPFTSSTATITDMRDGSIYHVGKIGSHAYFLENLHYKGDGSIGTGFRNSEIMSPIFGRYYNWDEAMNACPTGWRLPSDEEYAADFQDYAGNEKLNPYESWGNIGGEFMYYGYFNEFRLVDYWPEVKVTNNSMFSALPFGYAGERGEKSSFKGMYDRAVFWTSSQYDDNNSFYRSISTETGRIHTGYAAKSSFLCNVRCIRELPE